MAQSTYTTTQINDMRERVYNMPQNYVDAPKWLGVFSFYLIAGFLVFGLAIAGPLGGIATFFLSIAICLTTVSVVLNRALVAKLQKYGNRFENIYIVSLNENDNTEYERADFERELLVLSGNRLNVEVIVIDYQYAEYVNETWDEYMLRVDAAIKTDRAARHRWLAANSPNSYLRDMRGKRDYSSPIQN